MRQNIVEYNKMNKKGQAGVGRAIGIVFLILVISVLGAQIFGSDGLNNTDFTGSAPAWVVTLLTVGVGIALVKLIIGRK